MKRMISLCCAGLMAFSLAACGSQNATSSTSTPQVTSSVVGKITALDGTTATLQLGELTENQPGDPPSQDGTQPSGDNANGDSSASGQSQTPPEKPEGESSSDSSAQTPPEKPEGDNNTQGTTDDGTSSTSGTDGQNAPPSDGQGPAPGSTFTAGEETTTVDLSGATVTKESQDGTTDASLSDLAVGDVIEVTMGHDNSATRGWGTAGKNGAQVTFTADAQTLDGDIEVDSISTLDLTLKNSSTFTGTINIVDNADGGTAVENNAVVTIEKGSKWVLTGDCTITSLTNNGTIDFNGHTITLADGTVLKG